MKLRISGIVLLILIVVAALYQFFRPLPQTKVALVVPSSSKVPGQLSLPLPSSGQSAVGIANVGLVGATANETPVPIASLTKMMTAYLVLQHAPLQPYQNGPTYTISAQDVSEYQQDSAKGDSVVKVAKGDKWTELQMLEGLLLPSGDNMANTLAIWTAGSEQAFVKQMNGTAKKLGMNQTSYADASGANPDSRSTATDQLKLAQAAMKLPVFRQIVDMPQATLPAAGVVYNVDNMVGKHGIVGIKTGSTLEAGGCFASAMYHTVGGQKLLLLGVVLGQQSNGMLASAINSSLTLLQATTKYPQVTTIQPQTAIADINVPWQGKIALETTKPATYVTYPNQTVTRALVTTKTASGTHYALQIRAGAQTLTLPLSQTATVKSPSISWRFTRGSHLLHSLGI